MKKFLTKIKYPKFLLLILTFIIAYLILSNRTFLPLHNFLLNLGYFGTFLTGILYTYGFTAAPATAMLLILAKQQNILLTGFIGGLGALIGDLTIFKFIRHSFTNEITKLSQEKTIIYLNNILPNFFKKYFIPILAYFIIAMPFPDEIGISLLAVSRSFSPKLFSILSYVLNTIGIFIILLINNTL